MRKCSRQTDGTIRTVDGMVFKIASVCYFVWGSSWPQTYSNSIKLIVINSVCLQLSHAQWTSKEWERQWIMRCARPPIEFHWIKNECGPRPLSSLPNKPPGSEVTPSDLMGVPPMAQDGGIKGESALIHFNWISFWSSGNLRYFFFFRSLSFSVIILDYQLV